MFNQPLGQKLAEKQLLSLHLSLPENTILSEFVDHFPPFKS